MWKSIHTQTDTGWDRGDNGEKSAPETEGEWLCKLSLWASPLAAGKSPSKGQLLTVRTGALNPMHLPSASAQALCHRWPFSDWSNCPRPMSRTGTERTTRCGRAGLLTNFHMPHLPGNLSWSQRKNQCWDFSKDVVWTSASPPMLTHVFVSTFMKLKTFVGGETELEKNQSFQRWGNPSKLGGYKGFPTLIFSMLSRLLCFLIKHIVEEF